MMATNKFFTTFILSALNEPLEGSKPDHFRLAAGRLFKIQIVNHHAFLKALATIHVDGTFVGTFSVGSCQVVTLDRAETKKRLTFPKGQTLCKVEVGFDLVKPEAARRLTLEEPEAEVSKEVSLGYDLHTTLFLEV